MHVLNLTDPLNIVPTIPTNLSQMLSINVDDPNNNNLIGQKSNPNLIAGNFNDSLLLSTNVSTTSVIVKHESTKQQHSSNNFKIHRPVPIDQENFFANNPSILLNSSNGDISNNLKLDQFASHPSHPRIAFRRISAPANLLSSQLNNFAQVNTLIHTNPLNYSLHSNSCFDDPNKLAELLLRQKLCQQLQLVNSKAAFTNCLNVAQNKTTTGRERQIDNQVALTVEQKSFNPKRRNSEPVNNKCKNKDGKIHFLWEFLLYLLSDKKYSNYICWLDQKNGIFKLLDSRAVSNLWGLYKNKSNMQYETLARALRYYYAKNLLRKINGRLVYQFVNLSEKQLDFNTTK